MSYLVNFSYISLHGLHWIWLIIYLLDVLHMFVLPRPSLGNLAQNYMALSDKPCNCVNFYIKICVILLHQKEFSCNPSLARPPLDSGQSSNHVLYEQCALWFPSMFDSMARIRTYLAEIYLILRTSVSSNQYLSILPKNLPLYIHYFLPQNNFLHDPSLSVQITVSYSQRFQIFGRALPPVKETIVNKLIISSSDQIYLHWATCNQT